MKGIFFILLFLLLLSISVFAQNLSLNCQYQEKTEIQEYSDICKTKGYVETNSFTDTCKTWEEILNYTWFVYDKQGNKYENPIEIQNIASSSVGSPSFDIQNKIPLSLSVSVEYDIYHSGGNKWVNNKEEVNITPLGKKTIVNSGASGILWGTTSIGNIRVTYLFNNETEAKIEKKITAVCKEYEKEKIEVCSEYEKKKVDMCKLCGGKICLNNGDYCTKNSECGSEICNIAKICGSFNSSFVVDCPDGLNNCNNETCLKPNVKENREPYICEWECKSKFGREGVCEMTSRDKTFRLLFISLSFGLLIGVIYFIWTDINPFGIFKGKY